MSDSALEFDFDFNFPADGNALDAFQWPDEENLMTDFMSLPLPTVAEKAPFQTDLDILDDPGVSYDNKKWMFDVLLNDVVPYRFHDHFRLFPDIEFYRVLVYNRPNRAEIWGLVERFHEWISSIAAVSTSLADEAIEALKLRAACYGWPEVLNQASHSTLELINEPLQHEQNEVTVPTFPTTPASSITQSTSTRAGSQPWAQQEHQHPLLRDGLAVASKFQYKSIIQDMDHFEELDNAYERHVKRGAGLAPEDDASWPISPEQQQVYVQQLFESITDLSNFFELRKARERLGKVVSVQPESEVAAESAGNPRKRCRGRNGQSLEEPSARPKGMSKTDWALVDASSTPVDLLEAVIHHRISSVEVELLCWRLLRCAMQQQQGYTMRPLWSGTRTVSMWEHFGTFSERWKAICDNLQDCKVIIHSLTRADWFCKYAGAPSKERGAKLSNDLLNGRRDIQNQVGRDVIREKTSKQDWTTSDDFEIRDKAGELVLKGGHLGDKKRRELAVRSNDS